MSEPIPANSTEPPAEETSGQTDAGKEITNASIVEAILFTADKALPPAKIAQILGSGTAGEVKKNVAALNELYAERGAAYRIELVAGGFQMMTMPVYHRWLVQLNTSRSESRLSQAALETLAIVAYKQPAVRADVEAIRGVSVGEVLNRLRELNLVKVVGRAEEIGRPMLYGTTRRFLEVFGLASLDDLPTVDALVPPERQKPATQSKDEAAKLPDEAESHASDAASQPDADPDPDPQPALEADG